MHAVFFLDTNTVLVCCSSLTNISTSENELVDKQIILNNVRIHCKELFVLFFFRAERKGSALLWSLSSLRRILYNYFHCIIMAVHGSFSLMV